MNEKLLNYFKMQIALKKITKEVVLAKYPEFEGKL